MIGWMLLMVILNMMLCIWKLYHGGINDIFILDQTSQKNINYHFGTKIKINQNVLKKLALENTNDLQGLNCPTVRQKRFYLIFVIIILIHLFSQALHKLSLNAKMEPFKSIIWQHQLFNWRLSFKKRQLKKKNHHVQVFLFLHVLLVCFLKKNSQIYSNVINFLHYLWKLFPGQTPVSSTLGHVAVTCHMAQF